MVVRQAWPEALSVTVWLSPPGPVKVTVPVGVPDPGALVVTVAQTVTDWPHTDGFGCGGDRGGRGSPGLTVTATVPVEVAAAGVAVVGGGDGAGGQAWWW